MTYTKPLPDGDPLMEPFWENARRHRLSVQSCKFCGDRHFPPGPVCPVCLSDDQEWEVVSGRARLISWVTFHRAYWGGFVADLPYDVCLVELEEGPLLMSNFLGARPENAAEGLPLKAVFDDLTETFTLPKFVAA